MLREALIGAGCAVVDAADDAHRPDVILVCVQRADLSPLLHVIRGRLDVPIVVICDDDDVSAALAAGASHCATRPLRGRELVARARDAVRVHKLAHRRATRERRMTDAILALQREKHALERLVCADALTGIANRRHAMELLAAEWKRAARDHLPLAVAMIDLDCFHAYNEQYGHLGGDDCLRQVVAAMARSLRRPSDFLGRYGGEEFVAVLPNTDAAGAKIVAERLRAAVEALAIPHAASACAPVVTITVGFAALRVLADVTDTMDRLIGAADAALLRAKADGRNRVAGNAPLLRPSRVSSPPWPRFAPVYADPWFVERVPLFLDAVRHEAELWVGAAERGDRRGGMTLLRLRQTAHQLGLVAVAELVGELGAAVRGGDRDKARDDADALLEYVTHVQVIYRRTKDEVGESALRST